MMQPVLIQSFKDKFKSSGEYHSVTVAITECIMIKCELGKILCLMQWITSKMYNAVQEIKYHMNTASELYYKAMLTMINYHIGTKNQGLFLKPTKN